MVIWDIFIGAVSGIGNWFDIGSCMLDLLDSAATGKGFAITPAGVYLFIVQVMLEDKADKCAVLLYVYMTELEYYGNMVGRRSG